MLRSLHIRNLAIIESLDLEFAPGFSVLTGETGAGKSILIDALGLVSGSRAEASLVRGGADRAEVSAEFGLGDAIAARDWLKDRELDDGETCLVRRVVQSDGRTRAFVNGTPLPLSDLRSLGELLVAIFGQGESQTLLRTDTQRSVLDEAGGHSGTLSGVQQASAEFSRVEAEILQLRNSQSRNPEEIEFLGFQLQELDALGLQAGDSEQLDAEHRRLANAGRLIEDGGAAQAALYGGEDSAYDRLSALAGLLRGLVPLHEGFADAENLVASAQAQVRDAADAIRRELDHLELDPERLQEVEGRLATIHALARKHRVRADELVQRHEQLREELAGMEQASERLKVLEGQRESLLARYREAALALSRARQDAASGFSGAVTRLVRQLGMPSAEFVTAVEALSPPPRPSIHGDDLVRFDFSANPGQPPRALAKVASGGELSRVSLAIQVTLQQANQQAGEAAATMVFDEVDAGIGGGVAEIVGRQLRALGSARQVMCVTHLAQVAAQGEQHFGIHKEIVGGNTFTRIALLDSKARASELARMIGGTDSTSASLALARELLKRAR